MQPTSLYHRRFTILLILLVCFILTAPFLMELVNHQLSPAVRVILFLFSTLWVAAATFAVSGTRKTTILAVGLMVVSLMLEIFTTLLPSELSESVFHLLRILFLGFIIFLLFKQIFTHVVITYDTINASICIYLLMGAM